MIPASCQSTMNDREVMGLPEHFTSSLFEDTKEQWVRLKMKSDVELLSVINNSDCIKERYTAASILALIGDPRIEPTKPSMVDIPGGEFVMGTPLDKIDDIVVQYQKFGVEKKWLLKECPEHNQTVKSFKIGRYPVTNSDFKKFLEDTKYPEIPTSWKLGRFPTEQSNHPVHSVTIEAIDAYLAWLNELTNMNYRLPSEAEWEFAASGRDNFQFPWGNEFIKQNANTMESNVNQTTPVGIYKEGTSPFGVHDMAGNVEEFVQDNYKPYPGGEEQVDHLNEKADTYRIARGGCFSRFSDLARCQRRHGRFPKFERAIFPMGFRVAHD